MVRRQKRVVHRKEPLACESRGRAKGLAVRLARIIVTLTAGTCHVSGVPLGNAQVAPLCPVRAKLLSHSHS